MQGWGLNSLWHLPTLKEKAYMLGGQGWSSCPSVWWSRWSLVMLGQEGMLILWGFVKLRRSPSLWSTITSKPTCSTLIHWMSWYGQLVYPSWNRYTEFFTEQVWWINKQSSCNDTLAFSAEIGSYLSEINFSLVILN